MALVVDFAARLGGVETMARVRGVVRLRLPPCSEAAGVGGSLAYWGLGYS